MKLKYEFKSLLKSFSYAFRGINYCINNERNMRFHIAIGINIILFALVFSLSATQMALLVFCIFVVMCSEMLNTSIETLVNLESPSYSSLAKIAKDVAAGAVLLAAFMAIIVGVIIFANEKLLPTIIKIVTSPIYLPIAIILAILSFVFVFQPITALAEPKTKIYIPKNSKK